MRPVISDPFASYVNKTKNPVILWTDQQGHQFFRELNRRAENLRPELFPCCRKGVNYQHKRNYGGMYAFIRTRQYLYYESFTELRCLVLLEHTGRIASISTQPFCLAFIDGTRHYPDFYAVSDDGVRTVYDVKPIERLNTRAREQFQKTTNLCETQGWEHVVLHGMDPLAWKNLQVLAYHRSEDMHPNQKAEERLLTSLQAPHTIAEAAIALEPVPAAWRLPAIYHLMFRQAIAFDHDGPITLDTKIWTGDSDATRCT